MLISAFKHTSSLSTLTSTVSQCPFPLPISIRPVLFAAARSGDSSSAAQRQVYLQATNTVNQSVFEQDLRMYTPEVKLTYSRDEMPLVPPLVKDRALIKGVSCSTT